MKWGERRFQNKDGSLTPLGKERYRNSDGSLNDAGKSLNDVNNQSSKLSSSLSRIRSGFSTADRILDGEFGSYTELERERKQQIEKNISKLDDLYNNQLKSFTLNTVPKAVTSLLRDDSYSYSDDSDTVLGNMSYDVQNSIKTAMDKCKQTPINSKEIASLIDNAVKQLDDIYNYTSEYEDDYEAPEPRRKSFNIGGLL